MPERYRKSPNARLNQVAGEVLLLRTDQPLAYALSDSGAVLWDALDHIDSPAGLEALLLEARPDLSPAVARREVRAFLDQLVRHGLASRRRRRRRNLRKKDDVTGELVGNELIVLSRSSRKVHLLNDSGALLWEALDLLPDAGDLLGVALEAWPDKAQEEVAAVIDSFLDQLIELGLVEEDRDPSG